MKKAMSNVDVAALVVEFRERLVGGFVGKAYQQSPEAVVITIQSAGRGKADLLLEAGRRVHLTKKPRKVSKMPPQFPTILRKRISGGRIVGVNQHEFDRVIEIVVEKGGERYLLIAELFPKGNVVLLDGSGKIILPLRPMVFRGRSILAGEEYLYHEGQTDPRTLSKEDLRELLAHSDSDLVRALVRGLNMGGVYGEEVCLRAGIDKGRPAASLDDEEVDAIHGALQEVFRLESPEPHLVYEDEGGLPTDVVPAPLLVYEGRERKGFESFSEALDEYFVEKEPGPRPKTALERRREMQEGAIEEFLAKEEEYARTGELIYERYGEIESVLNAISGALDKGFTYSEIWARIKTSGLPVAENILSIDYKGEVVLRLDDQEPKLKLNAGLSVPQNAQRYYDRAKETAKKEEGAKRALEQTIKLIEKKAAPKPKTRRTIKRRKPRWYERFRWFRSSDDFLIIGGRDASTNEEIYAKYLEKRDLALHTDAPGAPLTVIKTEGKDVPDTTLEEAARFAVSYSSVWKAGLFEGDCYLVKADQVTKTPESGEFLKKGAFVVRGERRYFRNVPVGVAVGVAGDMLIGGPSSAVAPKAMPVVEIEPGEYNSDDLAKRIYRIFAGKEDDRRFLKSVASTEQIVRFLPPGGSRVKG
ncbi:MAG: ribosome rescue protein RqcH [Euryarchaeota archaeon]|nr:ribosome rescue protein RqcH [Euryarchaeota archaeon]